MDIGKRILANQPFPKLMGVEIVSAEATKVVAKVLVRPDLCTAGNIMHGGAIMAFADALGAIGTVLAIPREAGTSSSSKKCSIDPELGTQRVFWTCRVCDLPSESV